MKKFIRDRETEIAIMEKQIIDILRNLMACASVTNTEKEIAAETWMLDFFRKQPV